MSVGGLWSRHKWSFGLAICLAASVILVNPLREFSYTDDWSFALTVRNLLETGQFRMHDWSASNTPFLAYWGSLFSLVGGFSFASLRISTLVLVIASLVAFVSLSRDHNIAAPEAVILAAVLFGSPLIFLLSFTFMSDAPFMACVVIAVALYTRGLRSGNLAWMLAGSAAASAAILTRQFGMALIAALLIVWLLSPDRRKNLPAIMVGLVLPILAAGWQLYAGTSSANWAAPYVIDAQLKYVSDVGPFAAESLWRVGVVLLYIAFAALPLIPFAVLDFAATIQKVRSQKTLSREARLNVFALVGLTLFFLIINALGVYVLQHPAMMPLLPWNLDAVSAWPVLLKVLLTLITLAGAVALGRLIILRYTTAPGWKALPLHQRLLDCALVSLIALQIPFLQFGDEYLLHLFPLGLILLAAGIQQRLASNRGWLVALTCIVMLISALWMRGLFNQLDAQWQAAESLKSDGVPAREIYTQSWEWMSYQGAFDDYLAQTSPEDASYGGYLDEYLPDRLKKAIYLITPAEKPPSSSELVIIGTVDYQDAFFIPHKIYILKHTIVP